MRNIVKKACMIGLMTSAACFAWADNFKVGAIEAPSHVGNKMSFSGHFLNGLNNLHVETGDTFQLVNFKTSQQLSKALAEGKVDLAFMKVEDYHYTKHENPNVKILALSYYPYPRSVTYDADFIALKTNKTINDWQNLQGKSVVMQDEHSLAGYIYPTAFLHEQSKNYKTFFKTMKLVKSHETVISDILAGSADAGVIGADIYQHSAYKDKFKVIYRIKDIPRPAVIGASNLSKEQVKRLRADLTALSSKVLAPYYISGFTTYIPKDFYDEAFKKIDAVKSLALSNN